MWKCGSTNGRLSRPPASSVSWAGVVAGVSPASTATMSLPAGDGVGPGALGRPSFGRWRVMDEIKHVRRSSRPFRVGVSSAPAGHERLALRATTRTSAELKAGRASGKAGTAAANRRIVAGATAARQKTRKSRAPSRALPGRHDAKDHRDADQPRPLIMLKKSVERRQGQGAGKRPSAPSRRQSPSCAWPSPTPPGFRRLAGFHRPCARASPAGVR